MFSLGVYLVSWNSSSPEALIAISDPWIEKRIYSPFIRRRVDKETFFLILLLNIIYTIELYSSL